MNILIRQPQKLQFKYNLRQQKATIRLKTLKEQQAKTKS